MRLELLKTHHCALCCISLPRCCFGLETRVIIKILTHPCYPINVDFYWDEAIKIFLKRKNAKWLTQNWDFQLPQFSISFLKISGIDHWVSRTNWCKGTQCGSTYMVIRLSDMSSKKGLKHKKCISSPFFELTSIYWDTCYLL